MMSKSGNRFISFGVSLAAKITGCSSAFVLSRLKRKIVVIPDKESLYESAEKIFPRPDLSAWEEALPPKNPHIDVSVIVPVFNAEKYVKECMDSILNQKTRLRVQIIAVNDGSTDGTSAVLDSYKNLPDVCCVDNPNPGSAARARNYGLLKAVGKYIMFVDSDDILLPNAIDTLFNSAVSLNADVVQGGWRYINQDGTFGCVQEYTDKVYIGKYRPEVLDLPGMPWGKIYRRELFENIRFPSGFTCFEDAIIHFLVFRKADITASVHGCIYAYRKNSGGIISASQNQRKAIQGYWVMEELLDADKKLGLIHDEVFQRSLAMQLSNYCFEWIKHSDDDFKLTVFQLCVQLYEKYAEYADFKKFPYAIKLAHKALVNRDFGAWCIQGRLFSLMR